MEQSIRQLVTSKHCDLTKPLPTTRELGAQHHVSNASACRLLKRLDDEGLIWRRENGRYFPAASRRLLERRKPYACLVRKLQHWSHMYQAVMSGFTEAFGGNHASMLFVHNETLVRHSDTEHPPLHASLAVQRETLAEFFQDHDDRFAGILLDDVWLDAALAHCSERLKNSVVVCRTTTLPQVSSVSVDFEASAMAAIAHLHARGYEEIVVAVPFANSAPVDLMLAATLKAAAYVGSPIEPHNICSAATPVDRERLINRLTTAKRRIGVFCLEDNITLVLWRSFKEAGVDCPRRIGLLAGMGDIVAPMGISSIKIDYGAIGRAAGEILAAEEYRVVKHPSELVLGKTT